MSKASPSIKLKSSSKRKTTKKVSFPSLILHHPDYNIRLFRSAQIMLTSLLLFRSLCSDSLWLEVWLSKTFQALRGFASVFYVGFPSIWGCWRVWLRFKQKSHLQGGNRFLRGYCTELPSSQERVSSSRLPNESRKSHSCMQKERGRWICCIG